MTMNLNNIFNQFSPDFFFLIPMILIATILNIIWLSISISSNWLPNQTFFIFNLFKNNIVNIIFNQTNINAAPWIPILTGIFILILSINFLGLLPYTFTSTSHISITYSIGVPLWMSVNFLGFYSAFQNRLSHLVPQGTPSYLIPFMVIIETLSLFAQPIALGLRLAANLTAGHLLIFLISTAIWSLSNNIFIVLPALLVFSFLFILEVAVACIQTYVFTSLIHFFLVQNL
uniref:ATP synthase F0 subunit 6 n=1 Tax=Xyloplax princealberti TaxID=3083365 RepID=UPI002E798C73|nr:ATP synthase F0 subunit 6 [Xyloplax princealberti]WQM48558.1 ATP synthase F0 subunit 6 [Xyloplax princealberti]